MASKVSRVSKRKPTEGKGRVLKKASWAVTTQTHQSGGKRHFKKKKKRKEMREGPLYIPIHLASVYFCNSTEHERGARDIRSGGQPAGPGGRNFFPVSV